MSSATRWPLTRTYAVADLSKLVPPPNEEIPIPLKKHGRLLKLASPPNKTTLSPIEEAPPLSKKCGRPSKLPPINKGTLPPDKDTPPLLKKHGRPPKLATAVAISAMQGCSPSNRASEANDNSQPPVKKPKGSDADISTLSLPPALQPPGKNKPKPALRTLPNRNCDPHPGLIARNPPRRTSAQVAADKRREEELKRSLEELAKRKVELLAEMEVRQQMEDEEEEQQVIKTFADVEGLEKSEEFDNYGGDTEIEDSNLKVDDISSGEEVAETPAAPLKVTVSNS
jgi:hypothetical protein